MSMIEQHEDECRHGLFPVSACSICNGNDARRQAEQALTVATFTARYDSRLSCGCYVRVGDIVARRADDRLVCGECAR